MIVQEGGNINGTLAFSFLEMQKSSPVVFCYEIFMMLGEKFNLGKLQKCSVWIFNYAEK